MDEFTTEDIKSAMWGCEGNRSPGPEGVKFTFIKKFWSVLGNDFCRMVSEFHSDATFARGCNASFLVPILKNDNPIGLSDYRPISLVGCIYKVIEKLLAERLGKVLGLVIS